MQINVETPHADRARGMYVHSNSSTNPDEESDIRSVHVRVSAVVADRVEGIRLQNVGGSIVDAHLDIECGLLSSHVQYPGCLGIDRFGTVGLSQAPLNLERVDAFARWGAGGSTELGVYALSIGSGDVVVRNSALRAHQTIAEEFTNVVQFNQGMGTALFENNVLIADSDSPNYASGAHVASFMQDAPASGYEFYGNTVKGFFYLQGVHTPVCAATTKQGTGFIASGCP